ncbi:hypothetical protein Enr17x_02520 [Gimesia fumaroli]|uniref:Uncharacterized protein n=1 Tax=Gimesia fumaroli TaxID=2527976 RepID=A0A518I553_9PLAN|nr:hypothetical protein Enr17x_02520 [Gimesia fumaroli]
MAKSAGQVNGNQLRIYIETSKPSGIHDFCSRWFRIAVPLQRIGFLLAGSDFQIRKLLL